MSQIEFTQGETVELTLTLKDALDAPIPITGDTFEGKIKDIADLSSDLASFTPTILDGPNGVIELVISDTDSLTIPSTVVYNAKGAESTTPSRVLFYDVFRTKSSDSTKRKVASGLVKVYPAITLAGA